MNDVRHARELFVWYRVASDRAVAARAEVDAMQRALEAQCPGLRARLLVRDDRSEPETWMETYAMVDDPARGTLAIDDAMTARIASAAAALLPMIAGDRHVEVFEPVSGS